MKKYIITEAQLETLTDADANITFKPFGEGVIELGHSDKATLYLDEAADKPGSGFNHLRDHPNHEFHTSISVEGKDVSFFHYKDDDGSMYQTRDLHLVNHANRNNKDK